jgi:hypothetical protein
MIEIGNCSIEESIPQIKFGCDLSVCKGACCTLPGGTGAPLLDEELEPLELSFPVIKSLLPQEHLQTIEQFGLYEGKPGFYTTMCHNNRACVFVLYEKGVASCAFEKGYGEGKLSWKKPLSCHLFPLRINYGMLNRIRYEYILECKPAVERGKRENISLSSFLREPLVRAFGSDWYEKFLLMCTLSQKNADSE